MNKKTSVTDSAFRKIGELTGLTAQLEMDGGDLDGVVWIQDTKGRSRVSLPAVIRGGVLGRAQLADLIGLREKYSDLVVIAGKITLPVREQLKEQGINYLDSAGNTFIHTRDFWMFVEGQKDYPPSVKGKRRLFTKTGLRLVFHLLALPEAEGSPYRALSETLGISLGSVTNTLQQLKEEGFLLKKGKSDWQLHNRADLLNRWISAYAEQLKPGLFLGRFRFADRTRQQNWPDLSLPTETCWGGEPAAYLLTHYLKPAEWTLYTTQPVLTVAKALHLLPDRQGPVSVFQQFWSENIRSPVPATAPPVLVYADLISTGEARNVETAKKISDEHLTSQI